MTWLPSKRLGSAILLCSFRAGGLLGLAVMRAAACPFCSGTAAAARSGAVHALRNGILVLSIPPILICAAIALIAVRRRYRYCADRHQVSLLGDAQQFTGRSVRAYDADFAGEITDEVVRPGQES